MNTIFIKILSLFVCLLFINTLWGWGGWGGGGGGESEKLRLNIAH